MASRAILVRLASAGLRALHVLLGREGRVASLLVALTLRVGEDQRSAIAVGTIADRTTTVTNFVAIRETRESREGRN